MNHLSRSDQADKQQAEGLVALGLYYRLHTLVDTVLDRADPEAAAEFQQLLQFAPPSVRESVLNRLDAAMQ